MRDNISTKCAFSGVFADITIIRGKRRYHYHLIHYQGIITFWLNTSNILREEYTYIVLPNIESILN